MSSRSAYCRDLCRVRNDDSQCGCLLSLCRRLRKVGDGRRIVRQRRRLSGTQLFKMEILPRRSQAFSSKRLLVSYFTYALNLPAYICRRDPVVLDVGVNLGGVTDCQTVNLLAANRRSVGGRSDLA